MVWFSGSWYILLLDCGFQLSEVYLSLAFHTLVSPKSRPGKTVMFETRSWCNFTVASKWDSRFWPGQSEALNTNIHPLDKNLSVFIPTTMWPPGKEIEMDSSCQLGFISFLSPSGQLTQCARQSPYCLDPSIVHMAGHFFAWERQASFPGSERWAQWVKVPTNLTTLV